MLFIKTPCFASLPFLFFPPPPFFPLNDWGKTFLDYGVHLVPLHRCKEAGGHLQKPGWAHVLEKTNSWFPSGHRPCKNYTRKHYLSPNMDGGEAYEVSYLNYFKDSTRMAWPKYLTVHKRGMNKYCMCTWRFIFYLFICLFAYLYKLFLYNPTWLNLNLYMRLPSNTENVMRPLIARPKDACHCTWLFNITICERAKK